MSEHILKAIEDLEAKIEARTSEYERDVQKIRTAINSLCEVSGMEKKYPDELIVGDIAQTTVTSVKPDQFYGKPLATAVREALTILRTSNRAPATVETIYELLSSGGYAFESKARDASIQSLSISIGKNSALFAKLNSGLIGLKEWYESAPRTRRKKSNGNGSSTEDGDQPAADADHTDGETATNPDQGETL